LCGPQNDFREELENCLVIEKFLKMNKSYEIHTTSQGKRTDLGEDHIAAHQISEFLNGVICKSDSFPSKHREFRWKKGVLR